MTYVLLDIMMPVMDGFKVLEIINQHAEWRHIPIIVISGLDDFDGIVRCIELGAEDFLLKPINNTLLNARIRASLEKKRLRDQEKFLLQKLQEYNNLLEQRIAEHQAELKMARRVQTSLLPKELPHVAGWDFAVTWIPAREIAGDYYDVIPMYNGSISFVVGDVTGKGLPASLFMVFARNCIRSNINRYKEAANQIFHANQQLCTESSEGLYITLFLCQIQPNSRQISFVNAGHEQPIFYSRQSNMLQTLPLSGKALGLEVDSQYQQHELTYAMEIFYVFYGRSG
jgi:serine phosphatase RsbU (regulator of sigma subunit)